MNKSLPELERPEFSEPEAGILLEENYGLCCTLEELPGERDRGRRSSISSKLLNLNPLPPSITYRQNSVFNHIGFISQLSENGNSG